MSSLSQIRSYFKSRMAVASPDRKEWQDGFNVSNIPDNLIDTRYHIDINSISSTPQADKHIEDSATVTVSIFKRGFREVQEAKDQLLDEAHCIRLHLIDIREVNNTNNIKVVESVTIAPEPIDTTNDNTIKVSMEFNVRMFFNTVYDY